MFIENIPISTKIGIGPKTFESLKEANIKTVYDLINIFPNKYLNFVETELIEGDVFVKGNLLSDSKVVFVRKNLNYLSFDMDVNGKAIKVTIFNRAFLKSKLLTNYTIYVEGKYEARKNTLIATNIFFNIKENTINPTYSLEKIPSKTLNKIILDAIDRYEPYFDEVLPKYILDRYQFPNMVDAYRMIHNPSSIEELEYVFKRFKYMELFDFELKLQYRKKINEEHNKIPKKWDVEKLREFIKTIPFELTDSQKEATNDIFRDLKSPYPANRLIQGDVGSGKTIVSAIAIYAVALDNYESCLMAPTEILATQHYNNLCELFKDTSIKLALLTSSLKGKKRTELLGKIKNGEVDVIVGTHALFTDDIEYNNLGLVITDEQHRFGVEQRQSLRKKGLNPDVIYLTATPIPRTLAITMFGDMDTSCIKQMPNGRRPIKTKVFSEDNLDIALGFTEGELKKGNQVYVISPLIEQSDKIDLHDITNVKEIIDSKFPDYSSVILHGKMKQNEKDEIMNDFINGKYQILISTTVIEVGIDNKNATVMLIFDADRFGLSQLHQLRGRVGRGEKESFCLLITAKENVERLNVIEKTTDGFLLSEEDLKLRGPGDFFGSKQSGMPDFRFADIVKDFRILEDARNDAEFIVENNLLEKYKKLKDKIVEELSSITD